MEESTEDSVRVAKEESIEVPPEVPPEAQETKLEEAPKEVPKTEQQEASPKESTGSKHEGGFNPKIVGFLCNWCSYAGADLAGVSRFQYPTNVRVIRVMCSGRLDPAIVIEMLIQGADGVFIGGCHIGDCHYIKGNYYAEKRYMMIKKLLAKTGLNPERLQLKWISASEGQLFADTMNEVTNLITDLGPSPVGGSKPDLNILEQLLIIRNVAEDYRLRVLIGKGISLVDEHNVYNEQLDAERFEKLLKTAIEEEYIRSGILYMTKEKPVTVVDIAAKIEVSPEIILQHVVTLKDRDLIKLDHIDGNMPYYVFQSHESLEEPPSTSTDPEAVGGD